MPSKKRGRHGHGYVWITEKDANGNVIHTDHSLPHGRGLVFRNDHPAPLEDTYEEAYKKAEEAFSSGVLDAFAAMHEDGLLLTDLDDFKEAAFYDTGGEPERIVHFKKGKKHFRGLLGEDENDAKELVRKLKSATRKGRRK